MILPSAILNRRLEKAMTMDLDSADPRPLYLQLVGALRAKIANGEWGADRRLPTATELAAEVGVNHNTALRALRILRGEGLVDFRRGRSATVGHCIDLETVAVIETFHATVSAAMAAGLTRRNLEAVMEEALAVNSVDGGNQHIHDSPN